MGLLGDLLGVLSGAAPGGSVELPRVQVVGPPDRVLFDLRAFEDPEAMFKALDVALEMSRTRRPPLHRTLAFADPVARHVVALPPGQLEKLAAALRERICLEPNDVAATGVITTQADEDARGTLCFRMSWDAFQATQKVPLPDRVVTLPLTGPLSNDLGNLLGPPLAKGATIAVPRTAPDYCHLHTIPGVGIAWEDEVLLDLRRTAHGGRDVIADVFDAARRAAVRLPRPRIRTWIVAPWLWEIHPLEDRDAALDVARDAVATNPPTKRDQVAIAGDAPPEMLAWLKQLGLVVVTTPRPIGPRDELMYPDLAQNFMLAYAAT